MKLIKTLMLVSIVCLLLPSCGSIRFINPLLITDPDTALTTLCERPVRLGNKDLTQNQVEKLWSQDRANLIKCYNEHEALVDFTLMQNKLLRGK
jgi:hypothetical protein